MSATEALRAATPCNAELLGLTSTCRHGPCRTRDSADAMARRWCARSATRLQRARRAAMVHRQRRGHRVRPSCP